MSRELAVIELDKTPGGLLLPVQAQPKARRNAVVGEHAGRLKVAVTQAPEKGKANDAVLGVLAEALGLKRSQVELASGATSARKSVRVSGLGRAELERRLRAALVGDL